MFQKHYIKFILLEQVQVFFFIKLLNRKKIIRRHRPINKAWLRSNESKQQIKIKYTTTFWRNIINIKKYSNINKVLYFLHTSSNIIILKINKIFYNVKLIVRNILEGLFSRLVESSCLVSKITNSKSKFQQDKLSRQRYQLKNWIKNNIEYEFFFLCTAIKTHYKSNNLLDFWGLLFFKR